MALITCKECKNTISNRAESCPQCGAIINKSSPLLRIVITVICLGLAIKAYDNYSRVTPHFAQPYEMTSRSYDTPITKTVNTGDGITITSIALAKEYEKNEARADATYKNQTLFVIGNITSVDKDFKNDTVIQLEGVNSFLRVSATIDKNQENKAIKLNKNSYISLECVGDGEVVSAPMLKSCKIIKLEESLVIKFILSDAEAGYASAQNAIGSAYYNGTAVTKNYEQAFSWYMKAAKQGLAEAQFNVGTMYFDGEGVKKDYYQANKWLTKALSNGVTDAQWYLDRIR